MTPRATLVANLLLFAIGTAFLYRRIGRSMYLGFVLGLFLNFIALGEAAMRVESPAHKQETAASQAGDRGKGFLLFGMVIAFCVGLYYADLALIAIFGLELVRGVEFFLLFALLFIRSVVRRSERDGLFLWAMVLLGASVGLWVDMIPRSMFDGAALGGILAAGVHGPWSALRRAA